MLSIEPARIAWSICLVVFAATIPSVASAANVLGFDPAIHERYMEGAPNPGFIIDESDISGVSGRPGSSANRAHLISPFHVVTARHLGAPVVRFRTNSGTFKTYSVSTSDFVDLTTNLDGGATAVSDVRIYQLTAPIPVADGVVPMPIFDGGDLEIVGQEIFVMDKNNRGGLNTVRDILVVETGGSIQTFAATHTFDDDPLHPLFDGVGVGEAQVVDGDSGRAMLLQVGDDLGLLGIHLAIDPDGDLYDGLYTNFSSLLTPYIPEIRSIVEADGYSISTVSFSTVPEPCSLAILSMIGVFGCTRRRR